MADKYIIHKSRVVTYIVCSACRTIPPQKP